MDKVQFCYLDLNSTVNISRDFPDHRRKMTVNVLLNGNLGVRLSKDPNAKSVNVKEENPSYTEAGQRPVQNTRICVRLDKPSHRCL